MTSVVHKTFFTYRLIIRIHYTLRNLLPIFVSRGDRHRQLSRLDSNNSRILCHFEADVSQPFMQDAPLARLRTTPVTLAIELLPCLYTGEPLSPAKEFWIDREHIGVPASAGLIRNTSAFYFTAIRSGALSRPASQVSGDVIISRTNDVTVGTEVNNIIVSSPIIIHKEDRSIDTRTTTRQCSIFVST